MDPLAGFGHRLGARRGPSGRHCQSPCLAVRERRGDAEVVGLTRPVQALVDLPVGRCGSGVQDQAMDRTLRCGGQARAGLLQSPARGTPSAMCLCDHCRGPTADDRTRARSSRPRRLNRIPTARSVHRHASASTRIAVDANRTHAFTGCGFGAIVSGSWSRPSSALVRDCKGRRSMQSAPGSAHP